MAEKVGAEPNGVQPLQQGIGGATAASAAAAIYGAADSGLAAATITDAEVCSPPIHRRKEDDQCAQLGGSDSGSQYTSATTEKATQRPKVGSCESSDCSP